MFDKVRGDSSETFVTMSQLEKAGLAIYRDAASIVLPNISPKEFFESLDENGDGKVTWEEFKNHLLMGSVGVSHAARMAHHAAIFEAITGGLSEETTINIAVLKAHVDNPTSLMNRYFPSMANKIASKFEELDADHSGDLDWSEFRDGCETFWMENMHPEAAVKVGKLPKVELKEAKNMGKGRNAEDLVHKDVPSHLSPSSVNNEEAAKQAAELLEKQQQEQELKAQEEHRKAVAAEAKKKEEDEKRVLEEKERAAKREEDAENAPVAPAKGGCCVIA